MILWRMRMFNYREILKKFDLGENQAINLYFLMSNNTNGYSYRATLSKDAQKNLIENVVAFFDTSNIKFDNQVVYDFKGKSDDNTIEYLEKQYIPIFDELIANGIQGTSDLKMMNFKKIKSFLIEIQFSEDNHLYLLSAFKKNSFLDVKKAGLFSISDDYIDTAKIPEKLISIPESFDICIYDGIVLFVSHSSELLNKIVSLESFYSQAIAYSLDMVEEMNLIEDFSGFRDIALKKKNDAVITKKFARLYSSKKEQFKNLKTLYESNIEKFKKNFDSLKVGVGFNLELNDDNKIKIDLADDSQVIALLNLLIDAYGKTFMLEEITEN